MEYGALGSHIGRAFIVIYDVVLHCHRLTNAGKSLYGADVATGMLSVFEGPLGEEDVDFNLLSYRYYDERTYGPNLCALSAEQ